MPRSGRGVIPLTNPIRFPEGDANLRNGSNAGLCMVNCRNRLGNANWNFASCDSHKPKSD